MTLTIGQFVRVQAPHPMQGMTGTVDYVEGGDVYVTLTAWGTDRLFAPRDLAPEERVPVAAWSAAQRQPEPEPVIDRAAEQRRRSAERMRERRRRQAAERVAEAVAALPPAAAREVSPFRRRVREKLRERAA